MAKSYYCIYYSLKRRQRKATTPAVPTPKGFMSTTGSNRCSNSCTPICLLGHAPNNMQHTKWAPNSLKHTVHTHTLHTFRAAANGKRLRLLPQLQATHSLAHNDDEHWAWMKTKLISAKQCSAIGLLPSLVVLTLASRKGAMGTSELAAAQQGTTFPF